MTKEAKPVPPDDSSDGVEAVGNLGQDETQGVQETEEKVTGITEDEAEGEVTTEEGAKRKDVEGEVDAKGEILVEESAGEAKPSGEEEKAEEAGTEVVEESVKGNAEEETNEVETAEKKETEEEIVPEEAVETGTKDVVDGEEPPAKGNAEGEVDAKGEILVEESAGEAKSADQRNQVEDKETEVLEGKPEEKAGAEDLTEEETAEKGKSGEEENATEESREGKESGEEKTVVADKKTAPEREVVEEEGEVKTAEEETGKGPVAEEEGAVVAEGGEEEEAGLVSSKELSGGIDEDVTDEDWIFWKKEFFTKFQKRFNKKWLVYGTGAFMLIAGLVVLLMGSNLHFADTGEVKSLKEIAGPVYDMKFFLPLEAGAGKTRFVKVTVAIELVHKGYRGEIEKKASELRKEIVDLVLSKSPKEVKSSQGKEKLRKEITSRLNKCLVSEGIKNTYFTEMVVL